MIVFAVIFGLTLGTIFLLNVPLSFILAFSLLIGPVALKTYFQNAALVNSRPINTALSTSISVTRQNKRFERIAFGYWFISSGIKFFFIFIFFGQYPQLGNLISSCISLVFAGLLLTLVLSYKRNNSLKIFEEFSAKALLIFVIWSGITLLWTRTESLGPAFGYWATMSLDILVVTLLLGVANFKEVAEKSLQGIVLGGLSIFLVAFLYQSETIHGRLGDVDFLNPNTIGKQIAVSGLCCIYLSFQKHKNPFAGIGWTFLSGLLVLALFQTLSKSAIIAFLIAGGAWGLFGKFQIIQKILLGFIFITVVAMGYDRITEYISLYVNDTQEGEALETLSGRTMIWETAWEMIKHNPILGYGFYGFRDYAPPIATGKLIHAHNEWLNIWFNVGIIGVALGILLYFSFFMLIRKTRNCTAFQAERSLASALLIFHLVLGITEGNPRGLIFSLPLLMLLIGLLSQKLSPIARGRTSND